MLAQARSGVRLRNKEIDRRDAGRASGMIFERLGIDSRMKLK